MFGLSGAAKRENNGIGKMVGEKRREAGKADNK
jgi:hypothetical protein